jgi:DnaJ-domain-containing protein 1
MNLPTDPFATFDLPERLTLDGADLEARYHALARRHHPDRFAARSNDEREAASEEMERINAAYRILRDPLLRLRHVLDRHGVRADARQGVPVELAETYFELQESLGDSDVAGALRKQIQASKDETLASLAELSTSWDDDPRPETLDALARMRDRHTYLQAMIRDIDGGQQGT